MIIQFETNLSYIDGKISTTSLTKILKWQKIICEKTAAIVWPAIQTHYDKNAIVQDNAGDSKPNYILSFVKLHSINMTLLLLGSVHHTCNESYFYHCKCDRMKVVQDNSHKYKLITNEEQLECYNKLVEHYVNKTSGKEVVRKKALRK